MYLTVHLALVAWLPFTLALFMVMQPRRALIMCVIGGWMFLPTGSIELAGVPDITKSMSVGVSALLGAMLCDARRLTLFRPHWLDLPMAAWCAAPFLSSLANDLGLYDALASLWTQVAMWGIPYFLGRVYFTDAAAMRDLAIGVLAGALLYVPFALFEVRMSPQLSNWIYGYRPGGMAHHDRFGGYRPVVFMQAGLMVGLFLAAGAVVGLWMYLTGAMRRLWGVPLGVPLAVLVATTVLSKAVGAIGLMVVGVAALWSVWDLRLRLAIWLLVLIPLVYVGVRSTEVWSGEQAVEAASMIQEERAQSLAFRFGHERQLAERAWERPLLGWGGWGRARIRDEDGTDRSVTDGLWIIVFGNQGLVGLAALMGVLLLPSALLLWRCDRRWWSARETAPVAALTVIPLLFAIDSLLNAMINPVWILIVGGLGGYYLVSARRRPPKAAAVVRVTTNVYTRPRRAIPAALPLRR